MLLKDHNFQPFSDKRRLRNALTLRQEQAPVLGDVAGTRRRVHVPAQGKTAQQKMQERLERVREKERVAKLAKSRVTGHSGWMIGSRRRLRGKQAVKAVVGTGSSVGDRAGGVWDWAFADEPR